MIKLSYRDEAKMSSLLQLTSIAMLLLLVQTTCCTADESFAALPAKLRSLSPSLSIRVAEQDGVKRLVLLATVNADGQTDVFNPFGQPEVGRPFQVVLMDALRQKQWVVVPTTPITNQSRDLKNWVRAWPNGLMGRCYWQRTRQDATEQPDEVAVEFPSVPAGKYLFCLLVNPRMIHSPPNPKLNPPSQLWAASWNEASLDAPGCISAPVAVDVDAQGEYHVSSEAGHDLQYSVLESLATVGDDHALSITTRLVAPAECWMLLPGMNLYEVTSGSIRTSVTRVDGRHFERYTANYAGSGLSHPMLYHSVLVLRHGIIGGRPMYAGELVQPGDYTLKTEVNESIYRDKLFVDGQRVISHSKEWPVVFQDPARKITVRDKAP